MQYLNTFMLFTLTATVCSIVLLLYVIKQRVADKSYFLIFLSFTSLMYTFGYLLEITSPTLEAALVSVRVQYMGLPFVLPISYLFVRDVYDEKRVNGRKLLLVFMVPFLSMITMQMHPLLRVFYTHIEYICNGSIANCRVFPGPIYYLHTVYSYLLFFLILRRVIGHLLKGGNGRKRQQSWILLAAFLIPMLFSILYVFFSSGLRYDMTPIANTLSMLLLIYSVRFHNLISVVPLARAQVIESMEDAFIVCDKKFNFLDANEAAKLLLPELRSLLPGDAIEGVEQFKNATELSIQCGDKTRFYKATQTYIMQGGATAGICIVLHDATDNEMLLKKLRLQASVDPLMEIYNRGTLFELADMMLSLEDAKYRSYALLMLDIDNFKQVNDVYGHLAGDFVLKTVALIIKATFRKDDIIGRYGGEEIMVLLNDISAEGAFSVAEKLRRIIETTAITYRGHIINITASIGVAHSPAGDGHLLEDMLSRADEMLYKAKNGGRNQSAI